MVVSRMVAVHSIELETIVAIPAAEVFIEGPVSSHYLSALTMAEDLDCFRKPPQQHQALIEIAGDPSGLVYIARHFNTIVAYITFLPPDPCSRWSKHPRILELGAIEVSPRWRSYKLGKRLLKMAFTNPEMEKYIVITIEFCWHWDTRRTGMDIWQYQRMLTRLFGSVGLVKVTTDDPDILEHPANVLMARIGKEVSPEDIQLFEKLRFRKTSIF